MFHVRIDVMQGKETMVSGSPAGSSPPRNSGESIGLIIPGTGILWLVHTRRFLRLFQPVPLLLHCQFHCEQLVVDVIDVLGGREETREEGTGVKLLIDGRPLRQDPSNTDIGGLHLHLGLVY